MTENKDETSYDILEWFPIRFCQDVFEHLGGKDVIQASAVNKNWNKLCAERQQLKKLKLVFETANAFELFIGGMTAGIERASEALEILQKGNRKYQNIEFRGSWIGADYLPIFAHGAGSWTSVVCTKSKILGDTTFIEILRIIEPTVEELSVDLISAELPHEPVAYPPWTFPCLKSLEGCDDSSKFKTCKYFAGCTTLVRFHWSDYISRIIQLHLLNGAEEPSARDDIRKVLRSNRNLKDMCTSDSSTFMEVSTDYKFKLQRLRVDPVFDRTNAEVLYLFLKTQAQTLETLEVYVKLVKECLELILSKMLKLLSFSTNLRQVREAILSLEQPLPVNTTVTSLELVRGNMLGAGALAENQILFETLLRALPSIKRFRCESLNDNEFRFLAREVSALESIETKNLLIDRFPDGNIFPNIKEFKTKYYPNQLEEPTGDGNFATLVKTEMRRYFAEQPRHRPVVDSDSDWSDD